MSKTKLISLVGAIIVITAVLVSVFLYIRSKELASWQPFRSAELSPDSSGYSPAFESMASPFSETSSQKIESFKGDRVCDARINEPKINPDDCIAQLTLDSNEFDGSDGQLSVSGEEFTGTLRVRNVRPELKNLKDNQIRCYLDAFVEYCSLSKKSENDNETIYRFSALNKIGSYGGFVPVGIEIRLDDDFHIAAIDWFNRYRPNGYDYKRWGRNYQVFLAPLQIGSKKVTSSDIQYTRELLDVALSRLNEEAQRYGQKEKTSFVYGDYPLCKIKSSSYEGLVFSIADHCGYKRALWPPVWMGEKGKEILVVMVSPAGGCPTFNVISPGAPSPVGPPASYAPGEICVALGDRQPNAVMTDFIMHELVHMFGAADHYDWLNGKDPNYNCNVVENGKVCPIAAEEIWWK